MKHIFKCGNCNKYTMKEICSCGSKTLLSRTLKYSPGNNLSAYRRKAKIQEYIDRGLL